MQADNPSKTVTQDVDVTSGEGGEAVAQSGSPSSSLAAILSKETGRQYPTDEAAIKSVKDTFSYVGTVPQVKKTLEALKEKFAWTDNEALTRMEELLQAQAAPATSAGTPPQSNVDAELKALKTQLDEQTFFGDNPDLKQHRDLLSELRGNSGKSFKEVAESTVFKTYFEKASAHDEAERSKSVLHSNPRLGQVRDKMSEAKEAASKGDYLSAKRTAVSAVLDSLRED